MRPRSRLLVLAAALAAAAAAGLGLDACAGRVVDYRADPRVVRTDTSYASGPARVAVERFAIPGRGRHPAVLVLHPSDGVEGSGGQYVRRYAQELALNGYVAYVVHYFDRTGDKRTDDAREDAAFPEWTAALEDAVTFARRDSAVAPGRVGAFGFSLGGWMALALGARDPRVGAVAALGGGFFDALRPTVKRMPPALLLHGADDDVVPVARVYAVDSVLRRIGDQHQLVVVPGQKHGFDDAHDAVARARVVRFFNRELRGRRTGALDRAVAQGPG